MTASLLPLLHLCDSLFPLGAFSHSDGLETATSRATVATADDLAEWMQTLLDQTLQRLEGPVVSRAWRAAAIADYDALLQLDAEAHALRPASAGREASRAMGSRLLTTWLQLHPVERLRVQKHRQSRVTLPVAFGTVCESAGISEADAVAGYAYTRLAATLSSAMRLMPLGQQQGHILLARALEQVPELVSLVIADAAPLQAFMPALDIATMQHQFVDSRLFRS